MPETRPRALGGGALLRKTEADAPGKECIWQSSQPGGLGQSCRANWEGREELSLHGQRPVGRTPRQKSSTPTLTAALRSPHPHAQAARWAVV